MKVNVLENSDLEEEDNDATINLVKQMHGSQQSDEDWLVDDPYEITHIETYEPKPKRKKMKYRQIKREVQSPTGLPGFYVAPKSDRKIIYEESKRQDEYTVFGEYIANKLRKFKMPKTRGNLQQLITTILWQAEYGMYDSADSVKRVLMHSVQTNTSESCTVEFVAQDSINEQVLHDSNENQCLESETLEAETE